MTHTAGAPSKRAQMDSDRKTALLADILHLITFASPIPAVFLPGPVLSDPHFDRGV